MSEEKYLQEHYSLVDGVFSIDFNGDYKTAHFNDGEYYRCRQLDYWQFGALIKELETIRRKMVLQGPDPWADPDMFTSGLD